MPRSCPTRRSLCSAQPRQVRAPGAVLAAALALLGLAACSDPPPAPPPLEIPVVQAIQRDQPIHLEMVGQTLGSVDIPIRARVDGQIESMTFVEGGNVEQDQRLYTIDPRPFESKVAEAQGGVAEAATARAKARADLDRIRPLAEIRAVSEQDLDSAVAQHEAAVAAVQAAEAQLEQAQIELGYTRIHAPIAGRIGLSAAKVGEYVGRSPNPVVLNYISQTDPIRVRFSIDEQRYLRLARTLVELRAVPRDQRPGRRLELILADGSIHEHRGQVIATDASVNPTTGTFTFEADFPNPDAIVLAGQFARVRASVETRKGAILVPQRCVSELQGIFRTFVVGPDGTVQLRAVVTGPKIAQLQIIEAGLEPGEWVALETARLRGDMKVIAKPSQLDETGRIVDGTDAEGA